VDTSGGTVASVVVALLVLTAFIRAALDMWRQSGRRARLPVLAIAIVVIVGVPSIGQYLGWPAVGDALRRDPELTLRHGEWWRIATAVVAQDGGLVAALFGLLVVAIALTLSGWVQGSWLTLAIFVFCSLVLNLLAIGWGAVGGGTSFASDGVMMSVLGLGLLSAQGRLVRVLAVVAIAGGVVLVALADAHGIAILLGATIGVVHGFLRFRRDAPQAQTGPAAPTSLGG